MSPTISAYQVLKKEIEKQKNLLFEVKFELMPRIKNVDENYAFEISLRINVRKLSLCLVASASELIVVNLFLWQFKWNDIKI